MSRMTRAIMWFRRDLRLADNPALLAALAEYKAAILVLEIMEIPFAKPRFARSFPEIERSKHEFGKL